MWLISTASLVLNFVEDPNHWTYAILSHTWCHDEVSFSDMADLEQAKTKEGFSKIERTCQLARERGIGYAWVDTCCIDKSISAELTEAINSMFRWYKNAQICFVFLSDLPSNDRKAMSKWFPRCRWFTRGWTLQELIASENVEFYDQSWDLKGTKQSLQGQLFYITGIDIEILKNSDELHTVPVARRMSWAASRRTTRVEDLAYCLFGIFDVNLPLIYGEGQKSFIRLQEAVAREISDLSLFAWESQDDENLPQNQLQEFRGILAESPADFRACGSLINIEDPIVPVAQLAINNQGFSITGRLSETEGEYLLNLDCILSSSLMLAEGKEGTIVIRLVRMAHGFVRHRSSQLAVVPRSLLRSIPTPSLPIPKFISPSESRSIKSRLRHRFQFDIINTCSLECNIRKKPEHLWDNVTESFITDGYIGFTGVLEIELSGLRAATMPESITAFSKLNLRYEQSSSLIVLFGLRSRNPISSNEIMQDVRHRPLKPWAGIYNLDDGSETSRALSDVISQEKTHGFPHVARQVRKIALFHPTNGQILPSTLAFNPVPLNADCLLEEDPHGYPPIKFRLSTELREIPDLSICKMMINIE